MRNYILLNIILALLFFSCKEELEPKTYLKYQFLNNEELILKTINENFMKNSYSYENSIEDILFNENWDYTQDDFTKKVKSIGILNDNGIAEYKLGKQNSLKIENVRTIIKNDTSNHNSNSFYINNLKKDVLSGKLLVVENNDTINFKETTNQNFALWDFELNMPSLDEFGDPIYTTFNSNTKVKGIVFYEDWVVSKNNQFLKKEVRYFSFITSTSATGPDFIISFKQ